MRFLRAIAVPLPALLLVGLLTAIRPADATVAETRADADWILSAQCPSGAIAHHVDRVAIWPYLSHFAAMGLAHATRLTGDRKYLDGAYRWLSWYQSKMDANGFVNDYTVSSTRSPDSCTETATANRDSTDSYAALFLVALRVAHETDHDLTKLRTYRTGWAKARTAILATRDADGLTWAKPEWRVKYLMDNTEVYAGLEAGMVLAAADADTTLAGWFAADAEKAKLGLESLWNATTGAYDVAKHDNGAREPANWSRLYPDALSQAWSVALYPPGGSRPSTLVNQLNYFHPSWDCPTCSSGGSTVGYNAVAGWASARVANRTRATTAHTNIRNASIAAGRAWPFTPSDAGQLIVLRAWLTQAP